MKIRSGFVSNSSSSSFIVRGAKWICIAEDGMGRKQSDHKLQQLLTKEQKKALTKFGFRRTIAHTPEQVPNMCDKKAWEDQKVAVKECSKSMHNYGYEITCNQDDVIQFLLTNKIPFIANNHYGHRHVFYDDTTDKVTVAVNFGNILEMYGVTPTIDTTKAVQQFTRKEYLKKVSY